MSEFATAWVLGKLYYGHHKPIILYGSFWQEIVDAIKNNMNVDDQEMDVFKIVEKREDIVPMVEHFDHSLRSVSHPPCKFC